MKRAPTKFTVSNQDLAVYGRNQVRLVIDTGTPEAIELVTALGEIVAKHDAIEEQKTQAEISTALGIGKPIYNDHFLQYLTR